MPDMAAVQSNSASDAPNWASNASYALAIFAGVFSAAAAGALAVSQLTSQSLPGCGPRSACAALAAGPWGTVPGLGWPTSFVGTAYFSAVLSMLLIHGRRVPALLRTIVRVGLVVSLWLLGVMVVGRELCGYCLAVHTGNLVLWAVLERMPCIRFGSAATALRGAVTYALVTIALAGAEHLRHTAAQRSAESQFTDAARQIVEKTRQDAAGATQPATSRSQPTPAAAARDARPNADAFTGRYRLGPSPASIRIVAFTDYQCPDCRRIENELEALIRERSDMSLSVKHFPMCPDCNSYATRNMHPNACWAARAAEAAGILRGSDGFWEMHRALFERKGAFTNTALKELLFDLQYDAAHFIRVMKGAQSLERVERDVNEGAALGLHFTPMIFINGVELRGWNAKDAVRRAVERVAATNPPPLTAASDHPVYAREKLLADWRLQPKRFIAARAGAAALGAADAKVQVVVFGDYRTPETAALDAELRRLVGERADLRYTYRHFPFDQRCNPAVTSTRSPGACRAARLAEAARELGGEEAFWAVHAWLLAHQDELDEAAIERAATAAGLSAGLLQTEMEASEYAAIVQTDARAGQRAGVTHIPSLFINGRYVPRWKNQNRSVLETMIDEAATKP